MVYAAVLGYGTVGSGVVEVLEKNSARIAEKVGEDIKVKYVLDLRDFPGDPIQDRVVHDFEVILNDPEVKIICETMGGNEPAYTFSKKALLAGKSVCTSNKELVANHGPELLRLARENKCNYMFEASVGGGIPIIRPLNSSLTAEELDTITGILNGTTNYILTRMAREGADFEDVLKEAQAKGYAEKDPTADVEGYDACRKIAILSSLMTGKTVDYREIYTEGISKITAEDFAYAAAMNRSIKLLAMSKVVEDGCFAMVAPFMIPSENPLYGVNDVFNAVFVHGNMVDNTMYYGRGAGKLPTASAVVSDVIDCARHIGKTVICRWSEEKQPLLDISVTKRRFFVRTSAGAENERKAVEVFGGVSVIEAPQIKGEFAFVTDEMSEKEFAEKLAKLDGVITRIRLED
ncbi:MAG: homoserine dehydrogenase [Lachnospiraceae bacterium]|nr:homoserine dehydrogenase [Lachnospiraceae bacterium]MDY4070268.1 homoserine dehydrogenase [Lachnospiraceae bacterium]